jgi:hypothetical protein
MGGVHGLQRTPAIDCEMVKGRHRVVGSCDEKNQPSLSFFLDTGFLIAIIGLNHEGDCSV